MCIFIAEDFKFLESKLVRTLGTPPVKTFGGIDRYDMIKGIICTCKLIKSERPSVTVREETTKVHVRIPTCKLYSRSGSCVPIAIGATTRTTINQHSSSTIRWWGNNNKV
jgi:hypothetical protein